MPHIRLQFDFEHCEVLAYAVVELASKTSPFFVLDAHKLAGKRPQRSLALDQCFLCFLLLRNVLKDCDKLFRNAIVVPNWEEGSFPMANLGRRSRFASSELAIQYVVARGANVLQRSFDLRGQAAEDVVDMLPQTSIKFLSHHSRQAGVKSFATKSMIKDCQSNGRLSRREGLHDCIRVLLHARLCALSHLGSECIEHRYPSQFICLHCDGPQLNRWCS